MLHVYGRAAAATIDIEERQRDLFLAGAGACGPLGSAKYRIAPPPVVGRIAVGTGSTLGAGHPFERGSAEGRKTRNVPCLARFRTSTPQELALDWSQGLGYNVMRVAGMRR